MWYESNNITNLAINFTTKCDLKCRYCYLFSKQTPVTEELSVEELINVVDLALGMFNQVTTLECWGGEPCLSADRLKTFATAMRERGKSVWVPSTNGVAIGNKNNYLAWRYANQERNSQVSFDGNKKFHNKYRCGTYDTVVNNCKKVLRMGSQIVLRTTYLLESFVESVLLNMIEYPRLYQEFLNDPTLDPRLVDIFFAIYPHNGKKYMMIYQEVDTIFPHSEILDKAPLYRQAYEVFGEELKKHKNDDVIFLPPYINDTVMGLLSPKEYFEPKSCGAFLSQVYLHSPTGDIYPCLSQDLDTYKDIGRLANVYTKEIDFAKVNTIRSFITRRNKKCFLCYQKESCFGPCFHSSVGENKEILENRHNNNYSAFNSYWNTANITKCIFSHAIFDKVVDISQDLIGD